MINPTKREWAAWPKLLRALVDAFSWGADKPQIGYRRPSDHSAHAAIGKLVVDRLSGWGEITAYKVANKTTGKDRGWEVMLRLDGTYFDEKMATEQANYYSALFAEALGAPRLRDLPTGMGLAEVADILRERQGTPPKLSAS